MVLRRNRLARAATQSPELAATFTRLQRVATQLTHLAWATPDPRQEANWRQRVAKLSAEKEQLEAELSARSAEYRQAKRAIPLEDLQAALSKDSVLVDFVEYWHPTPADKKSGSKATSERRLLGFVVAPDRPVEMVPLGAMQPINEAIRDMARDVWHVGGRGRGSQAAPRAVMGTAGRETPRGEDRAHFARRGPQPFALRRLAGQDAGDLSDRGAHVRRGPRAAVDPAIGARGRTQTVAEETAALGQCGLRRAACQGPGSPEGDSRSLRRTKNGDSPRAEGSRISSRSVPPEPCTLARFPAPRARLRRSKNSIATPLVPRGSPR